MKPFTVPMTTLREPRTGECLCDHWWLVDDDDGVLFYTARMRFDPPYPMCNRDSRVLEKMPMPGYRAVLIDVAYLSHALQPHAVAREEHRREKMARREVRSDEVQP